MQLLSHPFIKKHEHTRVDLAAFVRSVFDPTQRLKDLADVSIRNSYFTLHSDSYTQQEFIVLFHLLDTPFNLAMKFETFKREIYSQMVYK